MSIQEDLFQDEGTQFPGTSYARIVLSPAYDNAKSRFIQPMLAIHKAHLVMLVEQAIISSQAASQILKAIQTLDVSAYQSSTYTGAYEDLFFAIEDHILQQAGELAGNLHIARSRNDMGVAMYRMTLRDLVLEVLHSVSRLQAAILEIAEQNVDTVMLGYTHTQQAQPMTLAHYLLAVHDSLSRDHRRLRSALDTVNKSPLGAAALTTSGFPINRERVASLLGFDGLVENSYDAIGGADYLSEIAAAVEIALISLGRYTQDLLLWCTAEFGAILVAAPYVQISSIMPQKRNPVSFEHIRALASSGVGECQLVLQMLHNTPFGDIVDTEDDLQPHLWSALTLARDLFDLFRCVIGTMAIDKAKLLKRAQQSYAVVTELADTLVRNHALGFRTAHSVAARVVRLAMATGRTANQVDAPLVEAAAREVLGYELAVTSEEIEAAMDPVHFVAIRKLPGGPAPTEVRRMIAERRMEDNRLQAMVQNTVDQIAARMRELEDICIDWSQAHA